MENVSQAIKMAGSVLLFVIALSVAVLAFSSAREAIDAVLKYTDRETFTIEGDDRFYYLASSGDTKRYVGKETIIPTIYRACKESYKVIFDLSNISDDYYLYSYLDETGAQQKILTFDLADLGIPQNSSEQFLNGILYGNYDYDDSGKDAGDFAKKFGVNPNTSESLYDFLSSKETSCNIEEYLGTYYINDIPEDPAYTAGGSGAPEVDKQEKRVITYVFRTK